MENDGCVEVGPSTSQQLSPQFSLGDFSKQEKMAYTLLSRFILQQENSADDKSFFIWRNVYRTFTTTVIPALMKNVEREEGCVDVFKVVCLFLDNKNIEFTKRQLGATAGPDSSKGSEKRFEGGSTERTHKKRKIVDDEVDENKDKGNITNKTHLANPRPPSKANKALLIRLATSSIARVEEWASTAPMPQRMELLPQSVISQHTLREAGDGTDAPHSITRSLVESHIAAIERFVLIIGLPPLSKLDDSQMGSARQDTCALLLSARSTSGEPFQAVTVIVDAWIGATIDLRCRQRRAVTNLSVPLTSREKGLDNRTASNNTLKQLLSLPLDSSETQAEVWYGYYAALLESSTVSDELAPSAASALEVLTSAHEEWQRVKQAEVEKKLKKLEDEKARLEQAEADRLRQAALRVAPIRFVLEMDRRRIAMGGVNKDNPFMLLGIPTRIATKELIKKVSKRLYMLTHPDKVTDPAMREDAKSAFQLITIATPLALSRLEANTHLSLNSPLLAPPYAEQCGIPPNMFASTFDPNAPQPSPTHIPAAGVAPSWIPTQSRPSTQPQATRNPAPPQDTSQPKKHAARFTCLSSATGGVNESAVKFAYQPGLPLPTVTACEVCLKPFDVNAPAPFSLRVVARGHTSYSLRVYVSRPQHVESTPFKGRGDTLPVDEITSVYTFLDCTATALLDEIEITARTSEVTYFNYYVGFQTYDRVTQTGSQILWKVLEMKCPTKSQLMQKQKESLTYMLWQMGVDSKLTKKKDLIDEVLSVSEDYWKNQGYSSRGGRFEGKGESGDAESSEGSDDDETFV
eukprot:GHVN01020703.1.p1 GENE.GHVN01020703.1~~GHVN01020703.1.p1  ORF type:complete len:805 (-),score=153.80 GHVN01020703.1:2566-4980(-)